MIEGEHAPAERFVVDDVGTPIGLDLAEGFEGLQIEDRCARVTAVAGHASDECRNEGDAVHAWCVGNFADDFFTINVDYNDVCASCDV